MEETSTQSPETAGSQPTLQQQPETFDLARAEYSDIAAKEIGLPSLESMKLLKRVARELAGTPFCPEAFRNAPEAIFAAALTGREMGLAPLQSLRSFWPSPDGRLGMYSQAMMALMLQKGFKFEWHQCDSEKCEVTATRPDGGSSLRTSWSREDTVRAGLTSEKKQHGKYPTDMAMNRCIGRIFRFLGADLGGNTMYDPAELQEMADDRAKDTAPPAIPEPTEVKAGTKPRQKPDVVIDAKVETSGEPVKTAAPVIPIDSRPPDTDKPVERTVLRTEFIIYVNNKPEEGLPDFTSATVRAQALSQEKKTGTAVERVIEYSDKTSDRKFVAKIDYEPAPVTATETAPAATEEPAKKVLTPEEEAAITAGKSRWAALQAALPGKDDVARKKTMDAFMNGFFAVATPREWPRKLADRIAAMDALEQSLERPTDRDFVVGSPKEAGKQARLRPPVTNPIYVALKWSGDTIVAATKFREIFVLGDDGDFNAYVSHFLTVDEPDAYAYMRMGILAGRGTETLKLLREVSTAMTEPYGAIVQTLSRFTGDLVPENLPNIEAGLRKMIEHTKEPAAPAAGTETTAEATPAADDGDGW